MRIGRWSYLPFGRQPRPRHDHPAKLASYMASGTPILASITGEGAVAVQQADCGFATPAGDAVALADAMIQLYQPPPSAEKN